MKKLVLVFLFLIACNKIGAQINNLKDLLVVSELNVQELVGELQDTWQIISPEQDSSERGFIKEIYGFVYNQNGKKQVLKKCGRMNLATGQTFWLTNFISDDKELLNRIIKNLNYQGFELTGKVNSNSMYGDGNNIITIQKESDENLRLPNGCYSVNVVLNDKEQEYFYKQANNKSTTDGKVNVLESPLSKKYEEDKSNANPGKNNGLEPVLDANTKIINPTQLNSGNELISFKTKLSLKEIKKQLEDDYNFRIELWSNRLSGYSNINSCISASAEKKDNYTLVRYSWECD